MDIAHKSIKDLDKALNLHFNDIALLETAFTHRSVMNETTQGSRKIKGAGAEKRIHNERLEFLGDAVLELIISEYLFHTYPNHPEGDLTSFRAATVRTETLADTARKLHLGDYLRMSKGEALTGGRDKDYLLANTFEALLGAIYIDQGYEACKDFVHKHLVPKIQTIVENRLDIDAKTKFQEVAQAHFRQTPTYKLVKAEGPDHDRTFTMEVYVGKKAFGKGVGKTKQRAEEAAAKEGLTKFKTTTVA